MMMTAKRITIFGAPAALAAALLLGACGYHLVGHGGQFPAGIDKVTVPIFSNETRNTEIARDMTNSFIRELLGTGQVTVVPPAEAQGELRGVVTRYEVERITFDSARTVVENRLVVSVDVALFLRGQEKPVFEEKGVTRYYEYPVPDDLALERKEEDEGRLEVSRELSQTIIALITQGF